MKKTNNTALLYEIIVRQLPGDATRLQEASLDSLSVGDLEAIRTALAHELMQTGLSDGHEPNSRGMQIEDLIDYLGSLSRTKGR
jgi:hypothetical protein